MANSENRKLAVALGFELAAAPDADDFLIVGAPPGNYKNPEAIESWRTQKAAQLRAEAASCPVAGRVTRVVAVVIAADAAPLTESFSTVNELNGLYTELCGPILCQRQVFMWQPTHMLRSLAGTLCETASDFSWVTPHRLDEYFHADPFRRVLGANSEADVGRVLRCVEKRRKVNRAAFFTDAEVQAQAIKDVVLHFKLHFSV